MKKFLLLSLTLLLTLSLAACAAPAAQPTETPAVTALVTAVPEQTAEPEATVQARDAVRIAALKGPTGMGMVKLMADDEAGTTQNDYEFTMISSPDEIVSLITTGQVDIAAAPTNMAALLYNKTQGQVQMLALNTLGVLYILENGDTIHSVADLQGKTIVASGQGSTAEFVLNYLLAENGLEVGTDVMVEYKSEHAEAATLLLAGQADVALLPEPFVTSTLMKNADLRVALDLTDEWDTVAQREGTDSALTMACLIVRKEYAQQHPEAIAAFLAEYKASTEYVNADLDASSALVVQYGIMADAAAAKTAIPSCNIVYIDGQAMKDAVVPFLTVLYDAQASSVGGVLPADDFYFIAG